MMMTSRNHILKNLQITYARAQFSHVHHDRDMTPSENPRPLLYIYVYIYVYKYVYIYIDKIKTIWVVSSESSDPDCICGCTSNHLRLSQCMRRARGLAQCGKIFRWCLCHFLRCRPGGGPVCMECTPIVEWDFGRVCRCSSWTLTSRPMSSSMQAQDGGAT